MQPSYAKLRVFGCLCYPWVKPYNSHKLEPRSKACIFLGYSLTQSAYNCLDIETNRVFVSRHVNFVESVFPYHALHKDLSRPEPDTCTSWLSSASSFVSIPVSHAHSLSPPTLHETPRQTPFPDSRAQAASPTFSHSPTAAAVPTSPPSPAPVLLRLLHLVRSSSPCSNQCWLLPLISPCHSPHLLALITW